MAEQDAAVAESTEKSQKSKKPKKQSKPISPFHTKVFEEVLAFAIELTDKIESKSPMRMDSKRLNQFDYMICVDTAVKTLNKPSRRKWAKLLREEKIGDGAKRVLISKLAPLFVSPAYSLFPKSAFFFSSAGIRDQKKRLSVPARSRTQKAEPQSPAIVLDNCSRYFSADGQPQTLAEVRSRSEERIEQARAEEAEAARVEQIRAEEAARIAAEEAEPYYFGEADSFARQSAALTLDDLC